MTTTVATRNHPQYNIRCFDAHYTAIFDPSLWISVMEKTTCAQAFQYRKLFSYFGHVPISPIHSVEIVLQLRVYARSRALQGVHRGPGIQDV
jgi:hypothetical protein